MHGAVPIQLPRGFLASLHRALARGREPSEAAQLLRVIGFEAGGDFFTAFEQAVADAGSEATIGSRRPDEFWDSFSAFFRDLGWGTLRLERLHAAVAALDSVDWSEVVGTEAAVPTCHLTTGLLADLLSRTAGSSVAVLEVECRSCGDPRCRFLIGNPAVLGTLYEAMRAGRGYAEGFDDLA